jgi:GntR family transcriptional regulator
MASFTEDMKSRGLVPGSHILCFEAIPAQPYVAEALDLEPNAEVTHIKRLRLADDLAVGVHNTYLRDVDISCEELEVTESLYEVLQSKGIYLNEAEDMIEAVAATEEVADLLKMTPGSPILQVTRVARGLSGKPIELVIATYRNDLYRYIIRLKR